MDILCDECGMHKNKRPVILQVLPSLGTGGVERGTLDVARAIARAGWQPVVASSGGPVAASITHCGGIHVTAPLDVKKPLRVLRNIGALESIIRAHKVDIVHARSRAPAWSAYYAAKRVGVHFMTTFHGTYGLENEWKRRYNAIMTRGERVIAISNFIAKHIREEYPIDPDLIRVIHRGVDIKLFNPGTSHPQRMSELANQWRIPALPVILFPGRITRWKGQHVFIEALAQLPHRNFIALLLGDDTQHPDYHDELEALIVKHKLEGHVRLVGSTPHMPEAYTMARFVVATSVEPEAFGRVVVEAQAMGRPVIATDHGGAKETVIPGKTGLLVPPNDVEALSKAIGKMFAMDDAAYAAMGEAGVAQTQNFTADAMCESTLAVYQELLNK